METNKMDGIDQQIVELLIADARVSFSEIGKRVGLSRVAVKNRVTALEKSGIIKGYHAQVDRAASENAIPFCMDISVIESEKFEEILRKIKEIPSIRYVCKMSGGSEILAFGTVERDRQLENISWDYKNRKDIRFHYIKEIWSFEKGTARENENLPSDLLDYVYEEQGDKQ